MSNAKRPSPEDIYKTALADMGADLTEGSLKLLKSGLAMLQEKQKEPLRETELFALTSMISYKAHEQKTCETTVMAVLQAEYTVEEIEDLPSHLYQHAINFLVDLKMDNIIN